MNSLQTFSETIEWLIDQNQSLYPQLKRPSRQQIAMLLEIYASEGALLSHQDALQLQRNIILNLFIDMGLKRPKWTNTIDETRLPFLSFVPDTGWGIIKGKKTNGEWIIETQKGDLYEKKLNPDGVYASVEVDYIYDDNQPARALFFKALFDNKRLFSVIAVAALFGNILALAVSLYSMQVYDRVIPTENISTLIVLMIGTLLAALIEFVLKLSRHSVLEYASKSMDLKLSDQIYKRILHIRMDQFPASIGTLSSQVKGYESIRGFMSSATMFLAIDTPFALIFFVAIVLLAGPVVAAVPLFFLLVSLFSGIIIRRKIAANAKVGNDFSNKKVGLLVETIENAETIKANGTSWLLSTKWSILEKSCIENMMSVRRLGEYATSFAAFMQQSSYILLVSVGSYVAISDHSLTMGALIACSILSGRILAPIAALPGLMVQWAHAKAALKELEKMYELETDNQGVNSPLEPETIRGEYKITDLSFSYPERPGMLRIPGLQIKAGEHIAILGGIGTGKSTLLKLLTGMYPPEEGTILLDGLDIQQISRAFITDNIGYCSQHVRLFAGTLKENLASGISGVYEKDIMEACRKTGLNDLVASHPKGLNLEITEGGAGLSVGQKQLVMVTRLFLTKGNIWLLDEPTSAMDDVTERKCINAIKSETGSGKTLILVTHKPALLELVDRVIIISNKGIARDCSKNELLEATRNVKASITSYTPAATKK